MNRNRLVHAEQDNDDCARHVNWQRHALRRGRCDGTLAACRWKTSLAVLPRQRRWTPWFSPHIGDGRSGFGRGGGHQATFIARNGGGDSWNFPTLVHMGKKRRTRKAPPRRRGGQKAGAQFRTMEYRTAAGHMDDGCSPENVRRLDMDPHRTFKTCSPGSEIATGGVLSGNAETRRRADSKKLETADLKKAAAPLATHMRRLRGVRPEDEAPHVPESIGVEVPNDSRLQRQTRLQHRYRLAELLAAVRVRPSISRTSAGKRMAALHRWRRRKSAPAKDTPLSSSPRGTGNGTENGRERAAASPCPPPAHFPVGLGVKPS